VQAKTCCNGKRQQFSEGLFKGMRNELEQLELIDRYLQNRLSGEELVVFQKQMADDGSLVEMVNEQRFIHELVIDHALIDVKKKLQAIDANNKDSSNGNIKKWGAAGLGIVLVLIATLFFKEKDEPVTKGNDKVVTPSKETVPLFSEKRTVKTEKKKNKFDRSQSQILMTDTSTAERREKALTPVIPLDIDSAEYVPSGTVAEVITEDVQPTCGLESSQLVSTTEPSCSDSPTGKITIDQASLNGTPPFSFSIDGKEYVTSHVLSNLYNGSYLITVRDADGCTWTSPDEIVINEINCKPHEYSFYPSRGEVWHFPLSDNSDGEINIYNSSGVLVWRSVITNGSADQWDGTSNGQSLPLGSYSFIYRARNSKTISGSVTILR
jgi:hypothetical protein